MFLVYGMDHKLWYLYLDILRGDSPLTPSHLQPSEDDPQPQ